MAVNQTTRSTVDDVLSALPVQSESSDTSFLLDLVAREKADPAPEASASARWLHALLWGAVAALIVAGGALWMASGSWISRYLPW